jgi:CTP:molybdopterin cytidylyltransferase MocA
LELSQATEGLGCIVLAADAPAGPGGPRQLLEWRGEPMVRRAARTAVEAGFWPVVVVVGADGDGVRSVLAGMPLVTARSTEVGQAASIRTGLARLRVCCPDLRGAVIMGCSQPFVDEAHLAALAAAARTQGKAIAATSCGGALGPPALVRSELFGELLALEGDADASRVLGSDLGRVAAVALPHGELLTDSPEGWRRALALDGAEGPTFTSGAGSPLTPRSGEMGIPVVGKAHEAASGQDFVWFVYGSSLDRDSFKAWAREHGYEVPSFAQARPAVLGGYRLVFDVASRAWGGAVASLVESAGDEVEGLAVPMPGRARGLVEHKEGAVSGLYTALEVSLVPLGGGSAIPAVAFRSAAARRLPAEGRPVPAYLEALRRGARSAGLSERWIAHLAALGE